MDINTVIQTYMADPQAQVDHRERIRRRNTNISRLRSITQQFIANESDLEAFRTQLSKTLTSEDWWGATGIGFMQQIHCFAKYHNDSTNKPAAYLRDILDGLNTNNLGPRIEQFFQFLLAERKRLRQAGLSHNLIVAEGHSAFILSLFAAWLNPTAQPDIYYVSLRQALYRMITANMLAAPAGLNLSRDAVLVYTNSEHNACIELIKSITSHVPEAASELYWTEAFCYWLNDHLQALIASPILTIDPSQEGFIQTAPTPTPGIKDASGTYILTDQEQFLKNDPLMPVPEPLLTERICEIQRYILVEESTIRDIYHALLAGHVILSGPPGTGKTELARLIPEILWKRAEKAAEANGAENAQPTNKTAYTTRLVTATDEWSVRTLISGIAPVSNNGHMSYKVQYGHLTSAILKNWTAQSDNPEDWSTLKLRRSLVTSNSGVERGAPQTFRGQWLVIDEFNRAPIDLALGDALTALGGNDVLRVMTEKGSAELPIPKDFRVIGTLNSFDRNYLNQISEALKRRFSFVEILPPGRSLREAEQAVVLYKALERVSHLSKEIISESESILWESNLIEANPEAGQYTITWPDEPHPFREAFEAAWYIFEIIRIYRQLGTAQAISMVRHMLIAGILQGYTTREQWIGKALDAALCDTIADQLQVLLPDEIDTLLLVLTSERSAFSSAYNHLLARLSDRQQRLYGQLLSLSSVSDERGQAYLSDEEVETIAQSNTPEVAPEKLSGLFHLNAPMCRLPQFTRRLRAFKAERGL